MSIPTPYSHMPNTSLSDYLVNHDLIIWFKLLSKLKYDTKSQLKVEIDFKY